MAVEGGEPTPGLSCATLGARMAGWQIVARREPKVFQPRELGGCFEIRGVEIDGQHRLSRRSHGNATIPRETTSHQDPAVPTRPRALRNADIERGHGMEQIDGPPGKGRHALSTVQLLLS
jgi:hypothetical protein